MTKTFSYRKSFVMSLGMLGIFFIWPVFNHFVPLFLQAGNPEYERQLLEAGEALPNITGFGLGPSIAFFIMTWDNILNVFVQPWAGLKSDYTRSRFGKRKPWLMLGAPIAALGFVFIPVSKTVFGMMLFILFTNLGMALFRSPTLAWLGDLFEPGDRNKANGVVNMMGGLGSAVAGMVGGLLFDQYGRLAPFLFGSVGMLTFVSLAILLVREPAHQAPEAQPKARIGLFGYLRSVWDSENHSAFYVLLCVLLIYTAMESFTAGISSFAVFSLGIEPGKSAFWLTLARSSILLFAIPSGILGSRFGGRKIVNIGLIGGFVFLTTSYFLVQDLLSLSISYVLVGLIIALTNVNILPLVFQYGHTENFGANTGMYYFSTQSAAILGPVISGIVIEVMGNNFRMIYPLGTVIIVLAWLTLRKVGDRNVISG